jgi:hypothetical protein
MKHTDYYKSGQQSLSISNARKIAANTKYCCINCKNEYSIVALKIHTCKPCPTCNTKMIIGKERKFCSKSCAATFNNSQRTQETRTKQSNSFKATLIKRPELLELFKTQLNNHALSPKNFCRINIINCAFCNDYMLIKGWHKDHNKYCSSNCATEGRIKKKSHYNGHKKLFHYLNKTTNSIVILESTWELNIAQYLDANDIEWSRPKALSWTDHSNKPHLYYADFYLPKYDLYLDPKNPYVMSLDKDKMSIIEKQVNILYGAINYIKEGITLIHSQGGGS